jgi:uncharacterized protein with HEPN domain
MRDPKLYLKDILEAMSAIERFVEGVEFEVLRNSIKKKIKIPIELYLLLC